MVKHAEKYSGKCAAILSTGDLSQDHSAQSYLHFSERIKSLNMPCYWLPGNHDMQSVMLPSLLSEGLAQTKQIVSDHWQIILLDSQLEGVPHGHLSEEQLHFLKEKLQEYPDKYTLIAVHHHILPVGAAWLDQHILKNNAQFIELISQFTNVKAVLSGHVHQAFDVTKGGVRYLTSPSTCVQFKPKSNDFAVDNKEPGYRHLVLKNQGKSTLKSSVLMLANLLSMRMQLDINKRDKMANANRPKILLSLHGFHSSPASLKAQQMRDYLLSNHPDIQFHCPQLPVLPKQMWQVIETFFEQYKNYDIAVMGSSLGGFLATKVAQKYAVKALLINPAVTPDLLLKSIKEVKLTLICSNSIK